MQDKTSNHAPIPTELNIAPRGKSWLHGQLIDGEQGHPTRQSMESADRAQAIEAAPAQAAPAAVAVPDERAAFEKWARSYGTWEVKRDDDSVLGTTGYTDVTLTVAWHAIQARSALAATPAAAAPVVLPEPAAVVTFEWRKKPDVKWLIDTVVRGTKLYTEQQVRALLAGVSAPAALAVERGEVLVTVSGFTGSGKSAIAGEIEIMCRALGLQVEWPDSDSEKHMTHADWIAALEQYKPRVRIVECNVPHSVVKGQDK